MNCASQDHQVGQSSAFYFIPVEPLIETVIMNRKSLLVAESVKEAGIFFHPPPPPPLFKLVTTFILTIIINRLPTRTNR